VNEKDNAGNTPLHVAIGRGCIECVKMLLEYEDDPDLKLDINQKNRNGETPLESAIRQKRTEIAALLTNIRSAKTESPVEKQNNSSPSATLTSSPSQGGATHAKYKGRKYKIRTGKRGGRYILVGADKRKVYL
jgi:ankyrin repeat protein